MNSIHILFWNIRDEASCIDPLIELVTAKNIEVLLVAECGDAKAVAICTLLGGSWRYIHYQTASLKFFTNTAPPTLTVLNDQYDEHLLMMRLHRGTTTILLAGVHLPSKYPGASVASQTNWCHQYREYITAQELNDREKVVVLGDFNLNPYEQGMTDRTRGFRTVATRYLALYHATRKIGGKGTNKKLPRRYFYNPMWAFMGDILPGSNQPKAPGTYHWSPRNVEEPHWNCLDGVLFSPQVLTHFEPSSLEVLTSSTFHTFCKQTLHAGYSDHLPLCFTLANL